MENLRELARQVLLNPLYSSDPAQSDCYQLANVFLVKNSTHLGKIAGPRDEGTNNGLLFTKPYRRNYHLGKFQWYSVRVIYFSKHLETIGNI